MLVDAGGSFRDKQRGFREQEIVRQCIEMLSESGCTRLKMDDLARRLGISKATLYEHFRTRESLIRTALSTACSPVLDGMRQMDGVQAKVGYLVRTALTSDGDFCGCCFQQVSCPFGGWEDIDALVDELTPTDASLGTAAVMRALIAALLWRTRNGDIALSDRAADELIARIVPGA